MTVDALALLEEDHDRARTLLAALVAAGASESGERKRLLVDLGVEFRVHTRVEQELFYQAFLEAADDVEDTRLFAQAIVEHGRAEQALTALEGVDAGGAEFDTHVQTLRETIERHVRDEEDLMFPRTRNLMDPEKLVELGARMAEFRDSLRAAVGGGARGPS